MHAKQIKHFDNISNKLDWMQHDNQDAKSPVGAHTHCNYELQHARTHLLVVVGGTGMGDADNILFNLLSFTFALAF
jgi:hypothetical protein